MTEQTGPKPSGETIAKQQNTRLTFRQGKYVTALDFQECTDISYTILNHALVRLLINLRVYCPEQLIRGAIHKPSSKIRKLKKMYGQNKSQKLASPNRRQVNMHTHVCLGAKHSIVCSDCFHLYLDWKLKTVHLNSGTNAFHKGKTFVAE